MTHAPTGRRGRHLRQVLLAPAVVTALIIPASPAAASSLTGRAATTNAAGAAVGTIHAHVPRHPVLRFHALGRKVG
jgi:hypothetical protein